MTSVLFTHGHAFASRLIWKKIIKTYFRNQYLTAYNNISTQMLLLEAEKKYDKWKRNIEMKYIFMIHFS